MAYNHKHLFLTHVACEQRQVSCGSDAWPVALLSSYMALLCFACLPYPSARAQGALEAGSDRFWPKECAKG